MVQNILQSAVLHKIKCERDRIVKDQADNCQQGITIGKLMTICLRLTRLSWDIVSG